MRSKTDQQKPNSCSRERRLRIKRRIHPCAKSSRARAEVSTCKMTIALAWCKPHANLHETQLRNITRCKSEDFNFTPPSKSRLGVNHFICSFLVVFLLCVPLWSGFNGNQVGLVIWLILIFLFTAKVQFQHKAWAPESNLSLFTLPFKMSDFFLKASHHV